MAGISPFFNNNFFLLLLLLLLHLGCFIIFSSSKHQPPPTNKQKKRKISPFSPHSSSYSPSSSRFKSKKALSSSWSFLKRIFSTNPSSSAAAAAADNTTQHDVTSPYTTISTISSTSSQNYIVSLIQPETNQNHPRHNKSSNISSDHPFFPLRNDIFPCPSCGEIFENPTLLEHHQSIKHAVSELIDGDSGKNIVRIIFKTGWNGEKKDPNFHRILKIHNSSKILSKFEEYRETVKVKATRNGSVRKRNERCIVDGNELLRFFCTTFMCELGQNGNSSICNQQYCSLCGIIRSGFSHKMDGISTLSSTWKAHVAIPDEVEEEFKFMNVKRAMLVCRVVAGRVGCDQDDDESGLGKEDAGFDSVVGRSGSGVHTRVDEDELLVFNPRAVLPCFVIVYTV